MSAHDADSTLDHVRKAKKNARRCQHAFKRPGPICPGELVLGQAFASAVIAKVMAAEAAKIERIAVIAFMIFLPEVFSSIPGAGFQAADTR